MSKLRGRFGGPTSRSMQRFSSSLGVDLQMLDEDVDGSIAHVTMLAEVGLISTDEARTLERGLERVREELRSGSWKPSDEHEDVHMAVEARLEEVVGASARKLHTGRSRNDQVATDVRLWLKRRLAEIDRSIADLARALCDRVASDGRTLMPGYTHLQRGQPILLGHHLLAHAWALARDRRRFAACLDSVDRCPLGACAAAGTALPIDRERVAELLGFGGVADNAMDAVGARDHEQEVAAACAICANGLSRMADELVLWSSTEFRFVELADELTTGSSIMPQKRNPDAAELVRGKASSVQGDLVTLLGLTKGLPLAYNRDLQEDRRPLFDAVDTTLACLRISGELWRTLRFERERFEPELAGDFSLATELADHLVERGVAFRDAHEAVGRAVRWCEEQGGNLRLLTPEVAGRFHPELGSGLASRLDPRAAAERKTSRGGTAWVEIERQLAALRRDLDPGADG